jgi:hypothetical protein
MRDQTTSISGIIKTKEEIIEDLKDFLIFSTSFILSLFVIFAVMFSAFWSSILVISIEDRAMLELLKNSRYIACICQSYNYSYCLFTHY